MIIFGSYARHLHDPSVPFRDIDVYGSKAEFSRLLEINEDLWTAGEFIKDQEIICTVGLKNPAIEFITVSEHLLGAFAKLPDNTPITFKNMDALVVSPATDKLLMWALRGYPVKLKHLPLKRPDGLKREHIKFYRAYRTHLSEFYKSLSAPKRNNKCP